MRKVKLGKLCAVCILAPCFAACAVGGEAVSTKAAPSISADQDISSTVRQTDSSGRPLPFLTEFPQRWNSGNDGTDYEPCTAATSAELSSTGLVPGTARDAASADFQTARGCTWDFANNPGAFLTQSVGNSPSLADYRRRHSGVTTFDTELVVSGRTALVGHKQDGRVCATYLSSERAVIVTSASFYDSETPLSEICDRAIAFTRATIDQMPE